MTLNGAVKQLHDLRCAEDMPFYYKPAIAAVINALLMDAQEVKRGKWINITGDEDSPRQCSACLQDFDYIDGLCYLVSGQHLPSYCPNCGAKMEGEEEK